MTAIHTMLVESDTPVKTTMIGRPGRTVSWTGATAIRELRPAASAAPIVFVVNDDAALLESLGRLIRSIGWQVRTFTSARDFLVSPILATPSCLVLDVAMAEIGGLELQRRVAIERPDAAVIFVTDVADVVTGVQAMKAGAVDFLVTPFRDQVLVNAIDNALERSRAARDERMRTEELRDRYASLTSREREVMALVVVGRLNKQVAADLGICEFTVKVHRGNCVRKMKADSLPDLVTMAVILGLSLPSTRRSFKAERGPVCVPSAAPPRIRSSRFEPVPA